MSAANEQEKVREHRACKEAALHLLNEVQRKREQEAFNMAEFEALRWHMEVGLRALRSLPADTDLARQEEVIRSYWLLAAEEQPKEANESEDEREFA